MKRIGYCLMYLAFAVLTFLGGGAALAFGYWASDRLYDAGIWPVGALMRIGLLVALCAWAIGILAFLGTGVYSLFRNPETWQ